MKAPLISYQEFNFNHITIDIITARTSWLFRFQPWPGRFTIHGPSSFGPRVGIPLLWLPQYSFVSCRSRYKVFSGIRLTALVRTRSSMCRFVQWSRIIARAGLVALLFKSSLALHAQDDGFKPVPILAGYTE